MLPHPPADAGLLKAVLLIGPVIEWASALLLVGAFALMLPLSSQRRLVVIWFIAWIAEAVSLSWPALASINQIITGLGPVGVWTSILAPFYWAARFTFLAGVALGGMGAAARRLSITHERLVLAGVIVAGLVLSLLGADGVARMIEAIATPIVFFGSVQFILARAVGARYRGLTFLALTMTLFGVLATCYLIGTFESGATGLLPTIVHAVRYSSLYGDAIALALLGTAVVVVIVQEAFLDVMEAHEKRIHDVAASELRLSDIIHAAQEAIVTFDASGRIELVNDATELLFGARRDQLVGRQIDSLIARSSISILAEMHDAGLRANRGLLTHPAEGIRLDGTRFPIEFTVGRLRNGELPGGVAVLRDLTEQHAALVEREAFDRRVAESEKMMAIGRVVSGVAHELNNPLAVVLGQSEQLADTAPGGEMKTGLNLIYEQAHRARHIVRDLLAFVRDRDEQREPVDLLRLVERTVAAELGTAMAQGVALVTEFPARVPTMRIAPAAIEQVLVNLIDNGIDAAGAGGTVRVALRVAGTMVEIVVEDSGRGVPDGMAGRVFEPFYSTKGPGRGTGLGLSVSLGIAQQHGGALRLENRPAAGIGARFVFALPLPIPERDDAAPPVRVDFPEPPPREDGAAAEVMLVDDEPAVRVTLAKMFKRAGWQVREAGSGGEALDWLLDVPAPDAPAVILCDLKMPGMGGQEFYEVIVERRPDLGTRVVFVTGDVVESQSSGFISASGRQVVEKPFTVAEIARAVSVTVSGG